MKPMRLSRHIAVPLAVALVLGLSGCGIFGGGDGPKKTPTVADVVSSWLKPRSEKVVCAFPSTLAVPSEGV